MKSTSRELLLFSLKWAIFCCCCCCCCCWDLADGSQQPSTAAFVVPLKSSSSSSSSATTTVTATSHNHKTHGIPWVWSLHLSKNANKDDDDDENPKVPAAPFFFARKMVTPLTSPVPPKPAVKEDNSLETTPGNSVVSPMEASYESIYTAAEEIPTPDMDDAAPSDHHDKDNGIDNVMEQPPPQPAEISENAEKDMNEVLSLLKDTLEGDKSQEEVMTLLGLLLEDANDEEEQQPTNIQQGQQEIKVEEMELNVLPMEESVEEIGTTGEEMVADVAEITEAEMAEELLLAGPSEGDNSDNDFRQSASVPAFAMEGFDPATSRVDDDDEISSSSFTAQEEMMMMENLPLDDGVDDKPTAGSFVENEEELTMMQDQVLGGGTVGSTQETNYFDETEPIVAGFSERNNELARQEESGSTLSLNDLVMETSGPDEESYDYPFMPGSVMEASPIPTQSSAADSGMETTGIMGELGSDHGMQQESTTEVGDSLEDVGVVQDKEPLFRSMLTLEQEKRETRAALAAMLEARERAVKEEQFARRLLASRLEQEEKERAASLAVALEKEEKEKEEAALAAVNLEQEVLMENAAGFKQDTSEATFLEPVGLAVPAELKESDSSTEGLRAEQQLDDGSQSSELSVDPEPSKMASQQLADSEDSFSEWDVNADPALQGFQQQQSATSETNEQALELELQDSISEPETQQELNSLETLSEDASPPARKIRTPGPYLTSEEESINTSRLSFIQPLQSEGQPIKPSRGTKKIAFMNEPLGGAGDRRRGEILEKAEALARESLQQSQEEDTALSNFENSSESNPEEPVPEPEEAKSQDPQARNEAESTEESDDSNAIIGESPQQMMEQQNDQPIQPVRGMLPDQPFGRTQDQTQRFAQIRPDDTGQWW